MTILEVRARAQRLGLPLETAAAILDAPGRQWREAVREQITELDRLIEQARAAQVFLTHALDCPAAHPASNCPNMTAALDQLMGGATAAQLRERYT